MKRSQFGVMHCAIALLGLTCFYDTFVVSARLFSLIIMLNPFVSNVAASLVSMVLLLFMKMVYGGLLPRYDFSVLAFA